MCNYHFKKVVCAAKQQHFVLVLKNRVIGQAISEHLSYLTGNEWSIKAGVKKHMKKRISAIIVALSVMVTLSACVAKGGTQDTASSTQQDAVHERVDSTAESGTVTELNAGGNDVLPCNHIYS